MSPWVLSSIHIQRDSLRTWIIYVCIVFIRSLLWMVCGHVWYTFYRVCILWPCRMFWRRILRILTLCIPDVMYPDVMYLNVLCPDVLYPDFKYPYILWVYLIYSMSVRYFMVVIADSWGTCMSICPYARTTVFIHYYWQLIRKILEVWSLHRMASRWNSGQLTFGSCISH
jgi:hypothetical protein